VFILRNLWDRKYPVSVVCDFIDVESIQ